MKYWTFTIENKTFYNCKKHHKRITIVNKTFYNCKNFLLNRHLEEVVAFADLSTGDARHPTNGGFAAADSMRSLKHKKNKKNKKNHIKNLKFGFKIRIKTLIQTTKIQLKK